MTVAHPAGRGHPSETRLLLLLWLQCSSSQARLLPEVRSHGLSPLGRALEMGGSGRWSHSWSRLLPTRAEPPAPAEHRLAGCPEAGQGSDHRECGQCFPRRPCCGQQRPGYHNALGPALWEPSERGCWVSPRDLTAGLFPAAVCPGGAATRGWQRPTVLSTGRTQSPCFSPRSRSTLPGTQAMWGQASR